MADEVQVSDSSEMLRKTGKKVSSGDQEPWPQIPVPLLLICNILGKKHLSKPVTSSEKA